MSKRIRFGSDFSCVSDTQAYKQAGNSVVVKMYEIIFKNLRLNE